MAQRLTEHQNAEPKIIAIIQKETILYYHHFIKARNILELTLLMLQHSMHPCFTASFICQFILQRCCLVTIDVILFLPQKYISLLNESEIILSECI
jgi:hypothetical protein